MDTSRWGKVVDADINDPNNDVKCDKVMDEMKNLSQDTHYSTKPDSLGMDQLENLTTTKI